MVINDDSSATRDTVLRVSISGENIDRMLVSSDSVLTDAVWEVFDTLKIVHAPRVEGLFYVYGRFTSAGGRTTGVFSDGIILDFSARILSLDVAADKDTLEPDDEVEFTLESGEEGSASVSFGSFITDYRLDRISEGLFSRTLIIPYGIYDSVAFTVGRFTDAVGNVADTLAAERTFTIRSGPLNPDVVARLPMPDALGFDLWYYRGYCFISDWNNAVQVVNVAYPDEPVWDLTIPTSDWSSGLEADGEILYVADGDGGVVVIAMEPPDSPAIVGRIHLSGKARDITLDGDFAYVACIYNGLKVLDIGDRTRPRLRAGVSLTGYGESICYHDTVVYVAGQWGISLVDVSNPSMPELISELPIDGEPQDIAYNEGHLFIATERRGVVVVDVSDPERLCCVAVHEEIVPARSLMLSHPFLYIGGQGVIQVVIPDDPLTLQEVGRIEGVCAVRGMFIHQRYLYVAGAGMFAVVDLFPED